MPRLPRSDRPPRAGLPAGYDLRSDTWTDPSWAAVTTDPYDIAAWRDAGVVDPRVALVYIAAARGNTRLALLGARARLAPTAIVPPPRMPVARRPGSPGSPAAEPSNPEPVRIPA